MRISSTLFFQTGLNSINAQQSDLMHLYQQIGSGKRMVTPADDPLAAAQAINIRQAQTMNERFAKNRDVANQNLGIEDNTLDSVNLLLQNLKTELIYAGNGTLSDADRATLGNVLSNARNNLLGLVNATDGSGQYLFSGAKGNTAAYQDVNGKIVYMGDAGQRKIQADQTRQIASSDVGSDIFNRVAPGTTSYLTTATDTNAGTGVVSAPMIMDPKGSDVGKTFSVEFSAPDVNGHYTYVVTVTDPAVPGPGVPMAAQDYIPGQTKSLQLGNGVQANFSGTPELGDSFVIEPASSSDYAASKGLANTGVASISSPEVSDYSVVDPTAIYEIVFTDVDKYQVSINGSIVPPPLPATEYTFVPGRENILQLPQGMQVKISGNPAAGDEFKVEASSVKTDLNIFDTLDSIIASLEKPLLSDQDKAAFQNTLNTAMQRLDVNYNNVLTVRSSVGARMNELDGLNANGAMRSLSYSAQVKQLEDVDYYSASTQLQLRTAALEAAALAFRKIQATSLFSMSK